MTSIETLDCAGLWQRTLLIEPGGATDTTTDVRWLQANSRFVDLRRPARRPGFADLRGAAGLADLPAAHRDWLDAQDGFAGLLTRDGDRFHWGRQLALQPPGPHPDEGRMRREGAVIVETGIHADYVEHWTHSPLEPGSPCWALELTGEDGSGTALLLRAGDRFGWAARSAGLVELALGTVTGDTWTITDSALPWREGDHLDPFRADGAVHTHDLDRDGHGCVRRWQVIDTEGDPTL
ncbi:hypothetical protein [Nocardia stercoris]|uniref:Uncharacterized protein n=1 Tax=Nocardia stercoris TaxID=2483361 RepID=A0A3M2KUE2_9NOCA|nr:hypothetical protein [Nocardia stercoris]RMI28070.1 hypothetical protein EBN03_31910 [Nocardia stercoris]